ncbi:hypothetical protein LWI28_009452 [Acer negundo]|uniref:Uncharacterized protein n=1 Tax=Acer negundo TaxID=4023 RepID=A0AAD5JKB1_ACENE|nr:hypothetical protein LWI28_009452 [Acer negundo]
MLEDVVRENHDREYAMEKGDASIHQSKTRTRFIGSRNSDEPESKKWLFDRGDVDTLKGDREASVETFQKDQTSVQTFKEDQTCVKTIEKDQTSMCFVEKDQRGVETVVDIVVENVEDKSVIEKAEGETIG